MFYLPEQHTPSKGTAAMQINTENTVKVSSNVHADGKMTLDVDALTHIMGVLTNLYSDKYGAVIREYSTNARDSHIAAGREDLPIEVTLPSAFNPTLVITDHGVGLSRDELLGTFSRYGASTKRDTNSQVGSFGLGSKSAFTMGGQFIVTARKDGRQVSAAFSLDTHGVGEVSILHDGDTTEGNGVTVSISVPEPTEMREAAAKFFRAWKPGTVLVDGQTPDNFYDDPESRWISDDILYTGRGGITVVMGSVAYPLPQSAVHTVRDRTGARWPSWGNNAPGLAVFVPIGAVDITPSREAIRDTERSLTAVSAVLSTLNTSLQAKITRETATAKDEITRVFAARPLLHLADHLSVPTSNVLPAPIRLPLQTATAFSTTARGGLRTDDHDVIEPSSVHLLTVLIGVPERRSAKRHAKAWIEANSNRRSLIMFGKGTDTTGQVDWFRYGGDSPVETVHFDDIELPARERTGSTGSNPILYHTSEGTLTPSEIKATGKPVAYGTTSNNHPALADYLTVGLTSRQSHEVFTRRVPGAVNAAVLLNEYNAQELAKLGDVTELAKGRHISRQVERITYALSGAERRFTHPAWHTAVRSAAAYKALDQHTRNLIQRSDAARDVDEEEAQAPLFDALPLLQVALNSYRNLSDKAIDHLVQYVNGQQA